MVFAILALVGVAQAMFYANSGSRQRGLVAAVACGAVVLISLFLKYRDRRRPDTLKEDESKPI